MFSDFLKILEVYKLKEVSRNNSNVYNCEKLGIEIKRKETTAEHVYSCLKLADYFLSSEEEFSNLDRLKVYELLMYHDDLEIEVGDVCVSNKEGRKNKEQNEIDSLPILADKYPKELKKKLIQTDSEFRSKETPEAKFANVIDKLDAMVHELSYPSDWAPKGFTEEAIREYYEQIFEESPTFSKYFKDLIKYLNSNGYFDLE